MKRRDLLRLLACTPIALRAQTPSWPPVTVLGNAQGLPLVIANGGNTNVTAQAAAPLLEDRRVVLMNLDAAPPMAPEEHTADRVCTDILAALTAAGIDRFAYYGYSFGAVIGLQVVTRSDRARAFLCGGWPPLGAQYRETFAVTQARVARGEAARHTNEFYRSLQRWNERDAVSRLTGPRLAFAGRNDRFEVDGQPIHIAASLEEHQAELERLGWQVRFVDGFGHGLGARLDLIVPLIREFLRSVG